MDTTTFEPTADQTARGYTAEGEQYSIARYGTTVVVTIGEDSDDLPMATEQEAILEFFGMVEALAG